VNRKQEPFAVINSCTKHITALKNIGPIHNTNDRELIHRTISQQVRNNTVPPRQVHKKGSRPFSDVTHFRFVKREPQISVANRDYHYLSRFEIAGAKLIYRQLRAHPR